MKNKIKIFFFFTFVFALMFFAEPQETFSEEKCQEIPLGQISERVLEINKEMIDDAFLMKRDYEKMFPPGRKASDIAVQCLEGDAENNCDRICGGGNPCSSLIGAINEMVGQVEELNSDIKIKAEKLEANIEELEGLMTQIEELKTIIAEWDSEKELLLNCPQAKLFGYIDLENCLSENDYYICKIEE